MRILDLAGATLLLVIVMTGACGNEESTTEGSSGSGSGGGSSGETSSASSGSTSGSGGATSCVPMSTEPCYGGPAGTAGVGACKEGIRTCNADGNGFGACVGEVSPTPENCATPADEDCDGAAPTCGSNNLWSKRFGVAEGYALGVGADGNPVVGGRFPGSISFGGNTLTSSGGFDAFVTKLDGASGEHIWSRRLGGSDDQTVWSLAVDAEGNVVVVGEFLGQMSVGGGNTLTSAGGYDIFVAKYDGVDGEHIWSRRFGNGEDQSARGVAVSKTGEVWVTGSMSGTVDFGVGTLSSAGSFDVFVLRLDSSGNPLQAKRFGDGEDQNGRAVTVDAGGNAVVTGDFRGAMDVGAAVLTSAGGFDLFVTRFDASGNVVYGKSYGNKDPQRGYAAATTASGNAVVSGIIRGDVDLGGGLLSAQNLDVFTLELTPTGQHVRSAIMGGTKAENPGGVAIGAQGRVIVGGGFQGKATFGGIMLDNQGQFDAFVARYDSGGDIISASAFGDNQDQSTTAVATDPAGHVFVVAVASGSIDFGVAPGVLQGGAAELVLAKLAP